MNSHSSGGYSDLQDDYKLFLLTKLTNAVQNLQQDSENPVLQVDFCRRIEVLLFHALRTRTFKWKTASSDVWDLLKEVSPRHIIQEILLLRSVKTDIGRIRAWIRVTINESTLPSYLQLLADKKLTKKYYAPISVFSDPQTVAKLTNLLSLVTEKGIKVLFNCDSFDFEVAPSATDLTEPVFQPTVSANHSTVSVPRDHATGTGTGLETSLEATIGSVKSTSSEVEAVQDAGDSYTCSESSGVALTTNSPPSTDTDTPVPPASCTVSPDQETRSNTPTQPSDTATTTPTQLPDTTTTIPTQPTDPLPPAPPKPELAEPEAEECRVPQPEETFLPSLLASPEDCPILPDPYPDLTARPHQTAGSDLDQTAGSNLDQTAGGGLELSAEFPDNLFSSSPRQTDNLPSSRLTLDTREPVEHSAGALTEQGGDDPAQNDILPCTTKESAVCSDDQIYRIQQQMGNSLHVSQDPTGKEVYIAQHTLPDTCDHVTNAAAEDDDRSAESVCTSLSSPYSSRSSGHSHDNLLQLLEAEAAAGPTEQIPIPGPQTGEPGCYPEHSGAAAQHEAHSLGSSLYRLFSRSSPTDPKPSSSDSSAQRISNLSQIHNAITDEIPISPDTTASTRNYIMGAGRATASYTYESASQWLSLSKDMWWWLQKRVIAEHDCQHPTPPQSDQLSGSPNSSLLELCTENCACCNAIVIDYCNHDTEDIASLSRSCPPAFSNITQHMQYSPRNKRPTYDSLNAKDYFNIDILENPAPPLASLNEAIETQKEKIQHTRDDSQKMKEVEILVNLRMKKQALSEQESDYSDPEQQDTLHILGHNLLKSTKLSGYCAKCSKGIYPRVVTSFVCTACNMMLHKSCINEISRHCSLAGKEALRLVTEIAPAHGLHEQNYCCFDCGSEICYSETKVHVCDYNGKFYCSECHKKTLSAIPARIIHNWDFRPKQISLQSAEVLSYLLEREYVNIEKVNPALFNSVSVLGKVRSLREKVILYKAYFIQCGRAMREGQFLKLKTRQHFIDSSKMYTVQDLMDANTGTLLPELETIVSEYDTHYQSCEGCNNHKFVCLVCTAPPLISPFSDHEYSTAQCSQCHGVLHRPCFNRSDSCPYCSCSFLTLCS